MNDFTAESRCKKKAFVTGGTGFVGSHLAKGLLSRGWEVHLLIRETSLLPESIKPEENVSTHLYDGTTDCLIRILGIVKPHVVFHLAACSIARHTPDDIIPLIHSNILLGTQLIEAMVKNQVYCLVNTGTYWQHYGNEEYNPVCLYAATKQAFEMILRHAVETSYLKAVTLVLYDTYGPGDTRGKLFDQLAVASKEQKPLPLSPGGQKIDFVFVGDCVEAYVIASEQLMHRRFPCNERYRISSGRALTLKEAVSVYESISGTKIPVIWGGRPYRAREIMHPWDGGTPLPGWHPKVSLEDGLRIMLHEKTSRGNSI
ncbi:NAD-dependent epimerase/dehydratase family protein [Desulfoluna butyratoxydans]|uniref:NAD-dependent epimerase/dehydratase family protein n=1 Tax=Desulfoluna butyratoxydans TaxID=231438 RepID=UPI0015D13915|nr:NAD(P)-dependent oxidoreductase [Desulfoluna butyratoxydans]